MLATIMWIYIAMFIAAVGVVKISHKLSYGHIPDLYSYRGLSSYLSKNHPSMDGRHDTVWKIHICIGHVPILLSTIGIIQAALQARRRAKSLNRLLKGMHEFALVLAEQVKDGENKQKLIDTASQIKKSADNILDPKSRPL